MLVHNTSRGAERLFLRAESSPRRMIDATFGDITSVRQLSDGSIAVADGLSREIRLFRPNAGVERTLGGRGDGPAEFRSLQAIHVVSGDSILVFHTAPSKLVVFPVNAGEPRVSTIESPASPYAYPRLVGVLGDGTLIAVAAAPSDQRSDAVRGEVGIVRYGPTGEYLNLVARVPGLERATVRQGPAIVTHIIPFGRNTLAAVGSEWIVVMDTHQPVLRMFDAEGNLVRRISFDHKIRSMSDAYWQEYVESELVDVPGLERPSLRVALDQLPRVTQLPVARGLLVDRLDRIWVGLADSSRWLVFDSTGRLAGYVDLPPSFDPVEVDSTLVVGTWRDDLDVETVRVYALAKPGHS